MRFASPWDGTLRFLTAAVVLLLVAIAAFAVALAARMGGAAAGAVAALVMAAAGSTLLLAWALAPKAFSIESGLLRIERPLRPVDVPLASVQAAGPLDGAALRRSVRVAGSGGLFGYYGRFWNRRLGAFRLYATRRRDLVHVDTAQERFVLSPEPTDRFLDALLSRAPAAARSLAGVPLERRPFPRRTSLAIAAGIALVPLAIGGVFLATYAWSPRAVAVEAGEIRIERQLAAPVVIPLSEVLGIRRLGPEDAGRFQRIAGTALPSGVAYGRFRSGPLGEFRLYAWRRGPYVLVETDGGRVVVTPDDADAFLAAVRTGGSR